MLMNQGIKWAALLVVVVSFARAQLRQRWPDQLRQWEHPVDLLILVTMIFLMMAATTNLGREPGRPIYSGPTKVASVALTNISLEHHV